MKHIKLFLVIAAFFVAQGCSHPLEVKNLNNYRTSSIESLSKDLSIGVVTPNDLQSGQKLVTGTAQSLSNYVGKVMYPYSPIKSGDVDILTKISVKSDHKGSGANFFINFPGFLIWTSAWNGFVYKPSYDIDVEIVNASDNSPIETFTVPIRLDVRHAEFDRTWTQITWLESGIIGFIGGIVFIKYDDDITPLVEDRIQKTIGDYIALEVSKRLKNADSYQAIIQKKRSIAGKVRRVPST